MLGQSLRPTVAVFFPANRPGVLLEKMYCSSLFSRKSHPQPSCLAPRVTCHCERAFCASEAISSPTRHIIPVFFRPMVPMLFRCTSYPRGTRRVKGIRSSFLQKTNIIPSASSPITGIIYVALHDEPVVFRARAFVPLFFLETNARWMKLMSSLIRLLSI